ncbi:MAG: hypothetical protein HDS26_03940 [Bacteroides sp.]|nr:hypothetical protein [Bacteroides sp.]MBD5307257.1 hypothetical protein [Bacteroides sp.]
MQTDNISRAELQRNLDEAFFKGVGSVIDFLPSFPSTRFRTPVDDRNAVEADWGRVGDALRKATAIIRSQNPR